MRCTCPRPTCLPKCGRSWISLPSAWAPAPAEAAIRGKTAAMTTPNRLPDCLPYFVRWAAAALVSAVLAFASQLALAHGGHHAEPAAAAVVSTPVVNTPGGDEQAIVAASRDGRGVAGTAWSRSCPDGSGG